MNVLAVQERTGRAGRRRRFLLPMSLLLIGVVGLGSVLAWWWVPRFRSPAQELAMPHPSDIPVALAIGADGAIWFTVEGTDWIGVVRDGSVERRTKPGRSVEPLGLAADSSGGVWFADGPGRTLLHLHSNGGIESFPLPGPATKLGRLAAGPDGAVWIADGDQSALLRFKDGQFTVFETPTFGSKPFGVVVAPDGTVWATLQRVSKLARLTTDGQMTEIDTPTRQAEPVDVAVDQLGAVWFSQARANRVGRFADGRFQEFPMPVTAAGLTGLAVGPDGAIWFAMTRTGKLGRLRDGQIAEFRLPRDGARPISITVDPAGRVWYADIRGWLGAIPSDVAARSRGRPPGALSHPNGRMHRRGDRPRDRPGRAPARAGVLTARLNELAVVFVSIVLQSLPFVLIGVFASALVQQYLAERHVTRWLPRHPVPATVVASLFGLVAPVCDCGAIPLGRRLASKGVPTPAALAFMLAAPVVNPVVIFATLVAFQGSWEVVGARMAMALLVAVSVALAAGALFPGARLARPTPTPIRGGSLERVTPIEPAARAWAGGPADPTGSAYQISGAGNVRKDLAAVVGHASRELFEVLFFVVVGALFTAAAQTMIPRGDLAAVGRHPFWSVVVLMPVATLLSICSEADAFVGRAFANTFTFGSVLAFLAIGQIVDLRNGFLMVRVLGGRLALFVFGVSYGLVLLLALAVNLVGGSRT